MHTTTYREQFNKLTEAYISGNVNPYDECKCFVGNMLINKQWTECRHSWRDGVPSIASKVATDKYSPYTIDEIVMLEHEFMVAYVINHPMCSIDGWYNSNHNKMRDHLNEDALFIAFEKTLDLLKSIHESKGEVIDQPPVFVKRESKVYIK